MRFHSLSWRIGLPFAGFVLAGSVGLVLLMSRQAADEQRAQLQRLARVNAAFLARTRLPASARMARDLQEVLGVQVSFRRGGRLVAADDERGGADAVAPADAQAADRLRGMPADGQVRLSGLLEGVAVGVDGDTDLLLLRPATGTWGEPWQARTFAALGAFWLLAIGVGWIAGRGLVRPLRSLAARLPQIESAGPVTLPAADRRDEIGDVVRAFLRTRDALHEERRQNERAEKLAMLGGMTAALAHEIQNPIAALKMHAQLWQESDTSGAARLIEREAERIEGLLSQWLFLSRPEPPGEGVVALRALLEQLVEAQRAQLQHARVRVTLEVADDLHVRGDGKRLMQVFRNLVVNAAQAMPRGGLLVVSARATAGDERVELAFADTGRGFSTEALARFGEFFYSEKEGGMGIGLSVAGEIVRAHGGELRAANGEGGGACVTVILPAAPASAAPAPPAALQPVPAPACDTNPP